MMRNPSDRASQKQEVGADVIIVGGGVAGCLFLRALRSQRPDLKVQLWEKAERLGGQHTWSFHSSDVPAQAWPWLEPLVTQKWNQYDVHFPRYSRTLDGTYCSITSNDLHEKIITKYPESVTLNADCHLLNSPQLKELLEQSGGAVIVDARGWLADHQRAERFGYQKFIGLDLELKEPHGLERPLIMDARHPQNDGFRFFYCLPWTPQSLLVEDTYYSQNPDLDQDRLKQEVLQYAKNQGWLVSQVLRCEVGSLPLALFPEPVKAADPNRHLISVGARSGFYHPVTGYTLPHTLRLIETFIRNGAEPRSWPKLQQEFAATYAREARFLRLLNRMLFLAAAPEERYRVLERFYRLSPGLIERFYGSRLTRRDCWRLLAGRPPVPIGRAVAAIFAAPPRHSSLH